MSTATVPEKPAVKDGDDGYSQHSHSTGYNTNSGYNNAAGWNTDTDIHQGHQGTLVKFYAEVNFDLLFEWTKR